MYATIHMLREYRSAGKPQPQTSPLPNLGLFGFGNFGKFITPHFKPHFGRIYVSDIPSLMTEVEGAGLWWNSPREVIRNSDIIVLAVPFADMIPLVKDIGRQIRSGTLVVDVCSVKTLPLAVMKNHLPSGIPILGTHPLFGPQSAKNGLRGHRIAVCPTKSRSPKVRYLFQVFDKLGLKVIRVTPEKHDREMTRQALFHFIAAGIRGMDLAESELSIPSFDLFMEALGQVSGDDSIFLTLQNGNPFAAKVRKQFMEELKKLEKRLKGE